MPRLFASRLFGPQTVSGGGGGADPDPPTLTIADLGNGGGGTATIAGSSSGSVNTLLAQRGDPAYHPTQWATLGSRSDDGAISFTRPLGHYWFCVRSTLNSRNAYSQPVYAAITDQSRQSVHVRCLEAIAVRIRNLALPMLAADSVVTSELPWLNRMFTPEEQYPARPMPCVMICPVGAETMNAAEGLNVRDDVGYPCLVVITAKADQQLRDWMPRYTLWRQSIARAHRQGRLPGVEEIIDMTCEPGAIVVPDAFARLYWHSALVVRCKSREPRGLGA